MNIGQAQNYDRLSGEAIFIPAGQTGGINLGNITMHKLDYGVERKEHFKSVGGVRKVDRTDVISIKPEYEIEGDEYHSKIYPILLFGTQSANKVQGAASAQSVTLTDVGLGLSYFVGKLKLSNVVVKVGSVVKTLGTDYAADVDTGFIRILEGGTIAALDDVIVEFNCGAITQESFKAFTQTKRFGTMTIFDRDGYDTFPKRTVTFPCDLFPENFGENNGEDFAKYTLKCTVTGDFQVDSRNS
jgi:hypothetical protein